MPDRIDPTLTLAYQRQHAGDVLTEAPDAPPSELMQALSHAAHPQSAGDFASLLIPQGLSTAISAGGAALRGVGKVPSTVRDLVRQKVATAGRAVPDYSTDVDLMAHGGLAPTRVSTPPVPVKRYGMPPDTQQLSESHLDDLVRHFGGTHGPTVRVPVTVPDLVRQRVAVAAGR